MTRRERLIEFMAAHTHVREERDMFDGYQPGVIDDDGELRAEIPYRFATASYDGSDTWIVLYDSIEDAAEGAVGELGGEVPWCVGGAIDLDTGFTYEPEYRCKMRLERWGVRWTSYIYGSEREHTAWHTTKAAALQHVKSVRDMNDDARLIDRLDDGVTS